MFLLPLSQKYQKLTLGVGRVLGIKVVRVVVFKLKCHFQQYFSYISEVSFIGEGNRKTWRQPPTCRKSLTNFIT
jgi:hypothetical protein